MILMLWNILYLVTIMSFYANFLWEKCKSNSFQTIQLDFGICKNPVNFEQLDKVNGPIYLLVINFFKFFVDALLIYFFSLRWDHRIYVSCPVYKIQRTKINGHCRKRIIKNYLRLMTQVIVLMNLYVNDCNLSVWELLLIPRKKKKKKQLDLKLLESPKK